MKFRKTRRLGAAAIGVAALCALPASASAAGNSALDFPGGFPGSFVTFPDDGAYDNLTSNVQVSADVNPDTVTSPLVLRSIISKPRFDNNQGQGAFGSGLRLALDSAGHACFDLLCSTATLPAGQFTSVVATYDGSQLTIQLNSAPPETLNAPGRQFPTDSQTGVSTPFFVGREANNDNIDGDGGRYFPGQIDDARVGPIGGTPLLQAYFNEGSGTAPANSGSLGGTGTFSGQNPPSYVALAQNPNAVTCVQTAIRRNGPGGFDQSDVTVTAASGLEAIFNVVVENGSVSVPNFTPGETDPVIVTSTKATQGQLTRFSFDASNVFDLYKHCE